MAVAQITASSKWHRKMAAENHDLPKLQRELLRAADRPGLNAELDADEVRALAGRYPEDALIQDALTRIEGSESRDLVRRAYVQNMMDAHRAQSLD